MRSSDAMEVIKDILQTQLPAVLTNANLSDFAEYVTSDPTNAQNLALCVYFSEDEETYYLKKSSYIVALQLYRILSPKEATLYKDLVHETIKKYVTPDSVEMNRLAAITSDIWPINEDGSTSFVYIVLEFESDLDGCEDDEDE